LVQLTLTFCQKNVAHGQTFSNFGFFCLFVFFPYHTRKVTVACASLCSGFAIPQLQASCSWDGTVQLWDLSSPSTQSGQSTITLKGHPDAVYGITASPSDPNLLISCGRKGSLVLWDLRGQGVCLHVCMCVRMCMLGTFERRFPSIQESGHPKATSTPEMEDNPHAHLVQQVVVGASVEPPTPLHAHTRGVFNNVELEVQWC
jgi:WD40 repeat protein